MPTDPFDPKPKRYLSVSQLKSYERCPHSYYLSRVKQEWQRPAAWLAQGTAVHAAIEGWERSGRQMSLQDAQALFRESYADAANEYARLTPNFEWWFRSGPYDGERDLARRFDIGREQVAKYISWATSHPEEVIWITPDGTPAIELEFDIELDEVQIRGYIDAVIVDHSKSTTSYDGGGEKFGKPRLVPWLRVRDHKTGNNPGDDFQLGVYSVALSEMYGLFGPYEGDYWLGRSGKPTYPFDLRNWTRNRVVEKFRELQDNIEAGRFDPLPDPDKCRFCNVAYACAYAEG